MTGSSPMAADSPSEGRPASPTETIADGDSKAQVLRGSQDIVMLDEGNLTTESNDVDPAAIPDALDQLRHAARLPVPSDSGQGTESPTNQLHSELESDGLEIMGRGLKKFVRAINELRRLGVEDLVLPLPKIVVVGDQSTGKSSLIEAISEIKVPRNVGTCTRCPLEINIIESQNASSKWTCKVSLHKKYIHDGSADSKMKRSKNKTSGISNARPLGPWILQEPEDFLFAELFDKDEVEAALYLAQQAILNPGSPHEKYMPGPDSEILQEEDAQVKFSPNVVRLDISGPGLPNLSFYDLPGVINTAETEEEEYLVHLVRNLVKEYIKADNCINLIALPMTDDAANSSAAGIIRDVRAQGRTIGVLTKPDRIPRGDPYDQWQRILHGEQYQLGHGYYVTKQPAQASLAAGITHAQARAEETHFFATTEPWASELAQYRERFGTMRLQTDLSRLLTAQIQQSLPYINEQVRKKAESIEIELASLPEPPADNLPMMLMMKMNTLNEEVNRFIDGGYPNNGFQKAWHQLTRAFGQSITDSAPVLEFRVPMKVRKPESPEANEDKNENSSAMPPMPYRPHAPTVISIDSEDENQCKPEPKTPTSSRKRSRESVANTTPFSTPSKRRNVEGRGAFASVRGLAKKFTIRDVREFILDARAAGIPNQVDPKAIERLSQESMSHWSTPMKEILSLTDKMLENQVFEILDDVLGPWKSTALFKEASTIIHRFLEHISEEQRRYAQRLYELEQLKPLTVNKDHTKFQHQAFGALKARRNEIRINKFLDQEEARAGKEMNPNERANKVNKMGEQILKQIGADPAHEEIHTMSVVLGYYNIASSRFVDSICLGIQGHLLVTFRNGILIKLIEGLGIMAPDAQERCAQLMAEDPQREIRRAQLKRERETLNKAQDWLAALGADSADVSSDDGLLGILKALKKDAIVPSSQPKLEFWAMALGYL
ncbi:MAG: hypothetical protein M1819_001739 [Sarea resinae]|nr:MAG: hypothetical protein M1819_001739 [Sarea resinae]